jgi:hypothetical protein
MKTPKSDEAMPKSYSLLEKTILVGGAEFNIIGRLVQSPPDTWVDVSWSPKDPATHYDGSVVAYVRGPSAGTYEARLTMPSTAPGKFDPRQPNIQLPQHLKGLARTVNATIMCGLEKLTELETTESNSQR